MNWLLNNNVKHSKNIIDLIEVGDYVNGYKVSNVRGYSVEFEFVGSAGYGFLPEEVMVHNIKSIVTKEQFASMEYRLEA